MKKILVIGLAAAMMTSTAFAADLTQLKPGDQIILNMSDFKDPNKIYVKGTTKLTDNTDYLAKGFDVSTTNKGGYSHVTYYDTVNKLGDDWVDKYSSKAANSSTSPDLSKGFGVSVDPNANGAGSVKHTQAEIDAAKKQIDMVARQDIQTYDFTAANFAVTVNAPVGKNFIKNYEFDGAGNLIVNLKADYRLPSETKPDLIISDVTVKSKRDIKKIGDNNTTVLYKNRAFVANGAVTGTNSAASNIGANTHFSVGVETTDESITAGTEVDLGQYQNGEWIKFTADGAYTGDVKFDGGNIQVRGKVYNGDVVNFTYNAAPTDAAIKVIQNNPVEANIMVHNIIAKNFKTGFTVSIPGSSLFGAEADANGNVEVLSLVAANNKKLYLLSNTGVITAAPFVYNNTTGAWEGRLPAQGGTILISDVALKGVTAGTTTGTGTGNPSTGFGVDFSSAVVK